MRLFNPYTIWTVMAPAAVNHLWQSTLFLAIAGLLAWSLKRNRARVRYALWMAASVKFLIPFSLLASLGSHLARPRIVPAVEDDFVMLIQRTNQLTPLAAPVMSPAAHAGSVFQISHLLSTLFLVGWLSGFVVVLFEWYRVWRKVFASVRKASPMRAGREVDAMRRVIARGGAGRPLDVILTPVSVEPGVVGIWRPVLVWPAGLSEQLSDEHIEAIIEHEVFHARRRDNLAGALHMLVEALFWFHPLVWWLRNRLVEEREFACDEAVLAAGCEPRAYAEGILKTCRFCVDAPLACVSRIAGATLKQRIVRIMSNHSGDALSGSKRLLLASLGIVAIAGPLVFGLANPPNIPSASIGSDHESSLFFNSFSISRSPLPARSGEFMNTANHLKVKHTTTLELIERAYGMRGFQIQQGASWIETENFDIDAQIDGFDAGSWQRFPSGKRNMEQFRRIRAILARKFNLKVRYEDRQLPIYMLAIAPGGVKLRKAEPGDTYPGGERGPNGRPLEVFGKIGGGIGEFTGQGISASRLARAVTELTGHTVVDRTGLKGKYDLTVRFSYDAAAQSPDELSKAFELRNLPGLRASYPSLLPALERQLGLQLELTEGPMDVLIIDHIDKPALN